MNRKTIEPELYDSESQQLLWSVHLKATPGRIALLDLLGKEKHPVSVARIIELLKKDGEQLSMPSVYRALEPLVGAGLVDRIHGADIHATYEMHIGRAHHHHIICSTCGDMEDIEKCVPKNIESAILSDSKKFSSVSRHSLEFFGICKKCVHA